MTAVSLIAQALETHEVVTCTARPTNLHPVRSDFTVRQKKRKGWFLSPLATLSHSPRLALINRLCGIACYKGPFPSQDLHVNQMDSAWVDYLPGHEITCK